MTEVPKDARSSVNVVEISRPLDHHREHIDLLIEETDRLIASAFSPADARRNPKVERNLRMLSALQGVSYENTCTTFGLPLSLGEKSRLVTSDVSAQTEKKQRKKKGSAKQISIDHDRVVALIREGKKPKDIARVLELNDRDAEKRLRVFLTNSGLNTFERQRIQREANPNIEILIERIKNETTLHGYFAHQVFELITQLQGVYEISLRQIADEILSCDVQLLYAHRQIKKQAKSLHE